MSDWWYLIAVAGIAIGGIQYLRSRAAGTRSSGDPRRAGAAVRDYPQERADARHAQMSDDDRAWEAASLQRDRDRQAPVDAPAAPRAPLG